MITLLIFTFFTLFCGFYLLLQGSLVRSILGILFLGNAANLIIFRFTGTLKTRPPLIEDQAFTLQAPYSDPLPQALILTAIVIGLGVAVFLTALALRAHEALGGDRLDDGGS